MGGKTRIVVAADVTRCAADNGQLLPLTKAAATPRNEEESGDLQEEEVHRPAAVRLNKISAGLALLLDARAREGPSRVEPGLPDTEPEKDGSGPDPGRESSAADFHPTRSTNHWQTRRVAPGVAIRGAGPLPGLFMKLCVRRSNSVPAGALRASVDSHQRATW